MSTTAVATTTIRAATHDDVDAMVAMGRQFLATEYPGRLMDNPEQLARLTHQLIDGDSSVVLVAEREAVIGMIACVAYAHPMSGELTAAEMFWWVDPAHRGCGLRLFRAAERWAREQGAQMFQMIAPSPEVERLYQRLGFTKIETIYHRSLA